MMRRIAWAVIVLSSILALAAPEAASAQSISIDTGETDGSLSARMIQLLILITVLSVAPGVLIMVTAFVRIIVVLSMMRIALGLQQTPPNMVIISLALFLTVYVMTPTFERAWEEGVNPYIEQTITEEQAFTRTAAPFKDFMLSQVREQDLRLFFDLSQPLETGDDGAPAITPPPLGQEPLLGALIGEPDTSSIAVDPPLQVLIPAFLISELRRAFEIGFLLFLPFIIIDMAIAALLMSMGMMMLPPAIISLPFKVIFFVLIEGWYLLAGSLVRSFNAV